MIYYSLIVVAIVCPIAANTGDESEFTALFDGRSLQGWKDENNVYTVENGFLVCRKGGTGKLLSERQYDNFQLCFEFRLTPGANNGLAIRAPAKGDPAYVGMELQILDNSADKHSSLEPYQYHGSIYGIAPARRGFLKPVGQWNNQEVRCVDRQVTVILNGEKILDVNIDEAAPNGHAIDDNDHPGLRRQRGHIGFLAHGDVVAFRNIRIKKIRSSSKE